MKTKTKTYTITRLDTNDIKFVKANSPAMAMAIMMDKWWADFYGPVFIEGLWEIYSIDGMKLKFTVT